MHLLRRIFATINYWWECRKLEARWEHQHRQYMVRFNPITGHRYRWNVRAFRQGPYDPDTGIPKGPMTLDTDPTWYDSMEVLTKDPFLKVQREVDQYRTSLISKPDYGIFR